MAKLPPEPHVKVDAEYIGALLRKRYPADEYAVLYEVRDGTGFHANRTADAIVVSLWPSRGLELQGFEFKVSRADWLKELRDPSKAESIAAYCDRWWVCVSDERIIQTGELPASWGLMTVKDDALRIVQEATKLKPIELDRLFVASICRSAQRHSGGQKQIAAAVKAARDEWDRERKKWDDRHRRDDETQAAKYKRAIADFEMASGVQISTYDAGKMGEAVRLVMRGELHIDNTVDLAATQLERAAETLREIQKLPALRKPLIKEAADG